MRTRHNAISWSPVSPPLPVHPTFLGITGVTNTHPPALCRLPPADHPRHKTNRIRFKTHDVMRLSSMPCIRSAPARAFQR